MNIHPKIGVGDLLFGMKQQHVEVIIGKPSKQFKDEEDNTIYLYNQQKMRLTFYQEEEGRLGYIVMSHPDMQLFDAKLMGFTPKEVMNVLPEKLYKSWEVAEEDGVVSYFNEENWLMLIAEFDAVVKVEIGAVFNDKDEFDWRFSG
jgi:hypothetical protein